MSSSEERESLVVIGVPHDKFYVYNLATDTWRVRKVEFCSGVFLETYSTCFARNDWIYYVGGGLSSQVCRLELEHFEFDELTRLNTPRTEHCSVLLDDGVLIMGGCVKKEGLILKSCEMYFPQRNQLSQVADMNVSKCGFSAVSHKG